MSSRDFRHCGREVELAPIELLCDPGIRALAFAAQCHVELKAKQIIESPVLCNERTRKKICINACVLGAGLELALQQPEAPEHQLLGLLGVVLDLGEPLLGELQLVNFLGVPRDALFQPQVLRVQLLLDLTARPSV